MQSHQCGLILAVFLCSNLFAQESSVQENLSTVDSTVVPTGTDAQIQAQNDQYYQLQILQQEVRTLRGLLEELNYQLQQIKQQQMDDYLDIDRRLTALVSSTRSSDLPTVMNNGQLATGDSQSALPLVDPTQAPSTSRDFGEDLDYAAMKADYDMASSLLLKNRDLDNAIVAFQRHIDSYPESPYIANAYYWLGEIYDLRDQTDLALQAFRIVVDIYTDHSKAMDARFKLGKLYHKLGQDQIAKQLLETAAQSSGGAAAKARAYLDNNPL